jgi:hypothetical protein
MWPCCASPPQAPKVPELTPAFTFAFCSFMKNHRKREWVHDENTLHHTHAELHQLTKFLTGVSRFTAMKKKMIII